MTDEPGPLNLAHPPRKGKDVITIRRFLPAIPCTPRRPAVSTALIARIAAGRLAGQASARTATPTANPVVAAMTGTTSAAPEPPAATPGNAPKPGAGKRVEAAKPASGANAGSTPAAP